MGVKCTMKGVRAVALFSGGKDSTFAVYKAAEQGIDITGLVSVVPATRESLMFHYPIEKVIRLQAESTRLPLHLERAKNEEEELNLLEKMLRNVNVDVVVSGTIASNYQRKRVDEICARLGLEHIAPLWNMDQEQELKELVENNFEVIITSVSAAGFDESWLGRKIDEQCVKELKELGKKHGINLSGEGGEYCTTVLNCPVFSKGIKIMKSRKVWQGDRGYLEIEEM